MVSPQLSGVFLMKKASGRMVTSRTTPIRLKVVSRPHLVMTMNITGTSTTGSTESMEWNTDMAMAF